MKSPKETKPDQSSDTVKILGYITVDSGSVMICDPVSVVGFTEDDYMKKVHGLMFDKDDKETGKTQVKDYMGVVHSTRWGDGIYEVSGVFNSEDEILAMMINFDETMTEEPEAKA